MLWALVVCAVSIGGAGAADAATLRCEPCTTDFAYDRLTCVVQPRGRDPEAILLLHGRGTRVPQEVELAINIRGARALAQLP
jgi:hypothetical protein